MTHALHGDTRDADELHEQLEGGGIAPADARLTDEQSVGAWQG